MAASIPKGCDPGLCVWSTTHRRRSRIGSQQAQGARAVRGRVFLRLAGDPWRHPRTINKTLMRLDRHMTGGALPVWPARGIGWNTMAYAAPAACRAPVRGGGRPGSCYLPNAKPGGPHGHRSGHPPNSIGPSHWVMNPGSLCARKTSASGANGPERFPICI
jgi:hypothetical protein